MGKVLIYFNRTIVELKLIDTSAVALSNIILIVP